MRTGARKRHYNAQDLLLIPSRRGSLSITRRAVIEYQESDSTLYGVPRNISMRESVVIWDATAFQRRGRLRHLRLTTEAHENIHDPSGSHVHEEASDNYPTNSAEENINIEEDIMHEFIQSQFPPTDLGEEDMQPEYASHGESEYTAMEKDAMTRLYEGSQVSKLSTVLLLLNLQQRYNVSNAFMDALFGLLKSKLDQPGYN
ncbi:hypothetical protein R1sor_007176 [Riccia sorocarpa]|uniref:Uncharacterized protein n=1 Tax=Riccia sorocarpa TaxID=122646 RepID=A0ABD3HPN6_9MARC